MISLNNGDKNSSVNMKKVVTLAVDYRRRGNDNMRSEFAINVYYKSKSYYNPQ